MSPACGLWCRALRRKEEWWKKICPRCLWRCLVLREGLELCADLIRKRRKKEEEGERRREVFSKVCFGILCGVQNGISRSILGVWRRSKVFSNVVFDGGNDGNMRLVRCGHMRRQFHGMVCYVQFTYWLTQVHETWRVLSIEVLMQASNKAVWGSHFQRRRLYNHMEYV